MIFCALLINHSFYSACYEERSLDLRSLSYIQHPAASILLWSPEMMLSSPITYGPQKILLLIRVTICVIERDSLFFVDTDAQIFPYHFSQSAKKSRYALQRPLRGF